MWVIGCFQLYTKCKPSNTGARKSIFICLHLFLHKRTIIMPIKLNPRKEFHSNTGGIYGMFENTYAHESECHEN